MKVNPATSKHRFEYRGETWHFCSNGCRTKFEADPKKYLEKDKTRRRRPWSRARSTPVRCIRRSARSGPEAARSAAWRWSRRSSSLDDGAQSRTRRHDAAVLDRPRAGAAAVRAGNGRASRRRPWPDRSDAVELDPVRLRDTRRAVGRLAVLRARLAIAGDAKPQHVHADRDRHRRGLSLQRRRNGRAGHFPGNVPRAMAARSRPISNRPPSSPCWCCSARCSNCAPARRRRARSRRCCSSRRRPRGASALMATTTRSRSTASRSAIACGCGPAKRCRSTASSSKAAPRSTNRW